MEAKPSSGTDSATTDAFRLDRRQFLKALGAGIIISFVPVFPNEALSAGQELPADFNAFLRIGEDGQVTCFTGKIEMGQGIVTSLAQMLAEELDVSLGSVKMIMGDTDLCPWDAGTFGSMSTKYFGRPLRGAAAEARAVLIQLAAERLGVQPDRLTTALGVVFDRDAPDERVSYGDLTKGKRIERHLREKPVLKPRKSYTIAGKATLRTDAVEKVTGKAKFTGDISLPGMLCARIVRPPAHGAKLLSVDTSEAEKVPGVRIVKEGDLVAALHSSPDEAEKALELIKADFSRPKTNLSHSNIFEHLSARAPQGTVVAQTGDPRQGRGLVSRLIEATYRHGYVAHAPMETHTALVTIEGDKVTVWASTQRPFAAKEELAQTLGVPPQRVRVITPFVGGGFGGKSRGRQVVEAARLAKATGKPVQVAWTREEEFFYDTFQPAAIVKISAGLNAAKQIVLWDYHVHFAGDRGAASFYNVPHQRTVVYGSWQATQGTHPFETGAWRAPASNTNTFARESHIDHVAAAVGEDPLAFRLGHLADKRMIRVLEATANAFGWAPVKPPSAKGQGMACGVYKGTYVAAMAEVQVEESSGLCRVKRVVLAQDMGEVVNPEGAKIQMEGCVMMGLGYALTENVRFRDGKILDLNFDTYAIPRFSWMPKIQALIVDNPDLPPQEGGEPAITCMGALVANAVFDATGARVCQLPLSPDRLREAMKSK